MCNFACECKVKNLQNKFHKANVKIALENYCKKELQLKQHKNKFQNMFFRK